ncbi:hypothetical protein DPMN_173038 [Dreissena polymorpha]|uniref:Secreted protein n=1 Tax=Dreissena polymorpha TaxID=45954 RepID=A0A9D4IF51_DREPO|nr:hypothetical protein DPMN_173038 [Dreissena polymorpha]
MMMLLLLLLLLLMMMCLRQPSCGDAVNVTAIATICITRWGLTERYLIPTAPEARQNAPGFTSLGINCIPVSFLAHRERTGEQMDIARVDN